MAFGSAGTLFVTILPNTALFAAALGKEVTAASAGMEKKLTSTLSRLSTQVTGIGTGIGANLGLGLAVAGVAATKMALDFEAAFTRIDALSNASATDLIQWKEQVLQLSGETAQAPEDLANALFFLSSAGLEAAQVMPALEASAKGAAIGLGTTADVANILASVLNAYADSGLTAAAATDVLTQAVVEGRAEPDEFAASLGRVLPIAAQAGVSFNDLSASIATLSNVGLPVDQAVTAMRGALQAIVAPGLHAAEVMDTVGISAQQLLDKIANQGLFGALQFLEEKIEGAFSGRADQLQAFREIIPNVRALTGVLGITGQEADKVQALFERLQNSVGATGRAFATTAAGPAFTFKILLNDLKLAAVATGEALLPLAHALAQLGGPILRVAGENANFLVTAFLGFEALKFLPGLLFSIGLGLEAAGAGAAASALGNLAGSIQAVGAAGAPEVFGALFLVMQAFKAPEPAHFISDDLAASMNAVEQAAPGFGFALAKANEELAKVAGAAGSIGAEVLQVGTGMTKAVAEFILIPPTFHDIVRGAEDLKGSVRDVGPLFEAMGQDTTKFISGLSRELRGLNEKDAIKTFGSVMTDTIEQATQAWEAFRDATATSLDFVGGAFSEFVDDTDVSLGGFKNKLDEAFAAEKRFVDDINELADAGGRGFDLLAQKFLSEGPAAGDRLHELLGAPKDTLQDWANLAKAEENFTDGAASDLTNKLLAPLKTIKTFFDQLALQLEKKFGFDFNLDGVTGAQKKVKELQGSLTGLREGGPYVPQVTVSDNARRLIEGIGTALEGITANPFTALVNVHDAATAAIKKISRALTGLVAGSPYDPTLSVKDEASAVIARVQNALASLAAQSFQTSLSVSVSGLAGGVAGLLGLAAEGGIIGLDQGGVVAGASGFITRGPTFLTGESDQMTFAGKGAEAVLPLDDRGIAILAEAMRRAQSGTDGHIQAHMTDWSRGIVDLTTKQDWNASMSFS